MNSSPFELFRRNLKPLMVLLTGLALFAFVALPVLDTYMRRSSGAVGSDVVATYSGHELTRGRVDYFTRNHQSTVRFLVELAQETISRGGVPQTAGFAFDDQNQRVTSVGINEMPSQMGSIRSLMLAALAEEDGFNLDDNALKVWLQQYTDGQFTDRDIISKLMQTTQNRMGQPHLYEQLRTHLLAQLYEQRGVSGLFLGQSPMSGPLLTPEEHWENFLKLNRSAIVSAYGISVDDYLPQTKESPSEIEIKAVYDEGKDRDPSEFSAEPGFHRQYVAKTEYVSGDLQSFVDAEVAKLSEEQIRSEYDRRIKGGDFLIPADEVSISDSETVDDSDATEGVTSPSVDDSPAEEAAATEAAEASDSSESGEPSTEADTVSSEAVDQSAEETATEIVEETSEQTSAPGEQSQSSLLQESSVRLVSLTQQDAQTTESQASENQEQVGDSTAAAPTEPQANAAPTASEQPEAADQDPGSAEPTVEEAAETVESFEKVRDEVAADMVRATAQIRMANAIKSVNGQMKRFFSENAMYENSLSIQGDTGKKAPQRPNLAELAAELGLQHEVIGPYSAVTISDEPIAQSVSMDSLQMGQTSNFVQMAYGSTSAQSREPSLPLFASIETTDPRTMRQYLAWKIEETAAYTPELDEVRDEVVMAIRVREARKLAVQAAQAMAEQAKASESVELKDLIPADKVDALQEGLGPFTWMTSFGFSGASLGVVPGIELAGADFMKAVFTNDAGTVSVATDQSGRMVYVLQADGFQPGVDELREQFKQPTNRFMSMMLGNGASQIVGGYFERMDEKSRFQDFTSSDR
ncbi:MAG: hypothetical protein ISQ09_12295 [Rubripirellula sp.]|nr:hypothetical protein [Rubripirellula sp.]